MIWFLLFMLLCIVVVGYIDATDPRVKKPTPVERKPQNNRLSKRHNR